MATVALLGTGIMGAGMGHNLLKAGHTLTVYNRTAAKTQPLVEAGATAAATPAAAVEGAEVIISIVGDDDSSRETWLGTNGVLAGSPQPNALAVESTTISLGWARVLGEALPAAGLRYIDCPVTGGRPGAENGTLTLLVGAYEDDLKAAQPVFASYSSQTQYFGPPPNGTAYKLVVNLMSAAQAVALAEGLAMAEKVGLDPDRVVEGLSTGAVASRVVTGHAPRMAHSDHDYVIFSARWMHKDARYGLKMAEQVGQPMPMSAVAAQVFQQALKAGHGDLNFSAVIEALR